ncbi:MAG: phytoene desaturase family protein [Solirubrobacteraceae bacterium]|nr:phytoene desaturase family protein [Solirubrobacteraceae bacterium]
MSRVVVAGAGVGGLACAVRLARAGHAVTVVEQGPAPGGKCARVQRDGFRFDAGPSLLTMPWLVRDLLGDTVQLVRVEPVTRYRFADGTSVELSADLPRSVAVLEDWSAGAGADWARFMRICAAMWRASQPVLTGPPPWPPRNGASEPPPDPRALLAVRPWHTLRSLARATIRDPRLRLVVERFATYAGADPRRAPAALAVAGYVEHAFGAWHVRGGIYAIVEALVAALREAGGELRCGVRAEAVTLAGGATTTAWGAGGARGRVSGVRTSAGVFAADAVVFNGDAPSSRERSLSGFALMLALRGRDPARVHHEIRFPGVTDPEWEDVFVARRPVRDPTLYLAASWVSDPGEAPADGENLFVLVNAPSGGVDWDREGERYAAHVVARLGLRNDAVAFALRRTPADLERETGAVGGAIYGIAPHGRLGTLRRPPNAVRGVRGLWRVGGTTHPGGGLPLVLLSGATVAAQIGAA